MTTKNPKYREEWYIKTLDSSIPLCYTQNDRMFYIKRYNMDLVWWILWIIIIVYVWIWIINNAFKKRRFKRNISIHIFALSLILVAFLYFYKDILTAVWLQDLYLLENTTRKNLWSFVIYCLSFIVLLTTSFGNINKKWSLRFIFIALLLFLWIGVWAQLGNFKKRYTGF